MAVVRFVMFVSPLKSRVYLTSRLIVALSVGALVFSAAYGTAITYIVWSLPLSRSRVLYIIDDGILLLVFMILNFLLFVHRLRVAKKSKAAEGLAFRMTIVVIMILILHTLKSVFTIIENVTRLHVGIVRNPENLDPFQGIKLNHVEVFAKLVHFLHPFFFFFSSPIVVKGISTLLHKCNLIK
jgi:hypothetical protein